MESSQPTRLKVAVIGTGKMGLSHLALVRAHPRVDVVAVCEPSKLVNDVLGKNTGLAMFTDAERMMVEVGIDALVIATPTASHLPLAKSAVARGIHVFCEKPLTLSPNDSYDLTAEAAERGVVSQVGYHNRFVASFQELQRIVASGSLGKVTHALAEAYGPVVLRPKGGTWRTKREEGGSCLYDYAAHPIDLLNWSLGTPEGVSGSVLGHVFSAATEDEVYATLHYPDSVSAQLSVNWSDESQRKMTTKVSVWGTHGMVSADRQECKTYLRAGAQFLGGYQPGWNVRYTTDLTEPVWFYLRGEEYSAQIAHFIEMALDNDEQGQSDSVAADFGAAALTDDVIDMLLRDAAAGARTLPRHAAAEPGSGQPLSRPGHRERLKQFATNVHSRGRK